MFAWIQTINTIDKRTVQIMDELEALKNKLAIVSVKMDAVQGAISAEAAEIKAGLKKLIEGLKAEPLDLSGVLVDAEALAGKADALESAVKGLSDEVFPVAPAPVEVAEPVTEAPIEEAVVE